MNMREDYAEYTMCVGCNASLLLCDCNCPKCGKKENCKCELPSIKPDYFQCWILKNNV